MWNLVRGVPFIFIGHQRENEYAGVSFPALFELNISFAYVFIDGVPRTLVGLMLKAKC